MNELRKANLLLVEDEWAILKQYQALLGKKYTSVFAAMSKQEGCDVFEQKMKEGIHIPVVVTDIQMESETAGIDLINEIADRHPATQFVIVSALHEKAFVAIQTAKANIASLPKPVPFMHLRLAIEAGIEKNKEFLWLEKLRHTSVKRVERRQCT